MLWTKIWLNFNDWFKANMWAKAGIYYSQTLSQINKKCSKDRRWTSETRNSCYVFRFVYNERLSWVDHINYVKKKMLSGMFTINAVKLFVPARILRMLNFSLVYLHILYGITLWSAAYETHLSKFHVLHKKIKRSVCNVKYNDHTNELYS